MQDYNKRFTSEDLLTLVVYDEELEQNLKEEDKSCDDVYVMALLNDFKENCPKIFENGGKTRLEYAIKWAYLKGYHNGQKEQAEKLKSAVIKMIDSD